MGPVVKISNVLKLLHKRGILLLHMIRRTPQYRLLQLSKFDFPLECGDNCVMVSDETIVNIENFVSLFEKPYVIGKKFLELSNLYPAPFDSTLLEIHKCKVFIELDSWPVEEMKHKIYLMPLTRTDRFAVFPIKNL
jgi:hypothetical protein